jgi:hypothetical protein
MSTQRLEECWSKFSVDSHNPGTGFIHLYPSSIFMLLMSAFHAIHCVSKRCLLAYLTKPFIFSLIFLACYISVFLHRGIRERIHLTWVFRLIQIHFLLPLVCIIRYNCFRRRIPPSQELKSLETDKRQQTFRIYNHCPPQFWTYIISLVRMFYSKGFDL